MIRAIVPAAGRSRRMGTQKLLLPFRGTTVIAHIARQLLASAVGSVHVVVGPDGGKVREALAELSVEFAVKAEPDADMLSSVRCGLRALPECDGVLVALGDQPAITSGLVDELAAAFERGTHGIVVPAHRGRRGHPIIVATRYRQEVLTSHDDVGLRGLLHAHADDVLEHPAGEAVLADMDRPDDYRRELDRR